MGFDFSGHILRDARVALSNAETTATAETGVSRDYKEVPTNYVLNLEAPDVVNSDADQYRTAFLDNPNDPTVEYLIFAANSSQLALLEDPSWANVATTGASIPQGTLTVTNSAPPPTSYTDGVDRVVVTDSQGRSIATVTDLQIRRGDNDVVVVATFASQDADAGVVFLDNPTLAALGGGASQERGDQVVEFTYIVAAARFWWTRNDAYQTRFGWNAKTQRWEPYKGGAPDNLGKLLKDEAYRLTPTPGNLSIGDYLPGTPAPGGSDTYAMLRLGAVPDSGSFPVAEGVGPDPNGVLVVRDEDAESDYNFAAHTPQPAAVMGVGSGVLQWNPAFIDNYLGENIWYNYVDFDETSIGQVGPLLGSDSVPLFIAPIPGPTERPLLKIGFRRYLTPLVVFTDAELLLLVVSEGYVGVSLATGQLKLSQDDIDKSDPNKPQAFNKQYLGAQVYYDGVVLNRQSQGTRAPVQLVDDTLNPATVNASSDLFIPDAQHLRFIDGITLTQYPQGRCGIIHYPDGTGSIPLPGTPGIRPGGDNLGAAATGLVRHVEDVGDTILFSNRHAIETLKVVAHNDDLPTFSFEIDPGVAYVVQEKSPQGSKIGLSSTDRSLFRGDGLYFMQASLTPATYANEARMYSRNKGPFTFQGTEKFYFSIDGSNDIWDVGLTLGAGTFTATQVAASIATAVSLTGTAYAYRDYVVLESATPFSGQVEIGWGQSQIKDLSGASVLGFLPGWRIDTIGADKDNWLVDSGVSFGLYRSPVNLDRASETPDFQARGRLENQTLVKKIDPQQYVFLDVPPLQDVAGYDDGVFFQLVSSIRDGSHIRLVNKPLDHFEDVLHQFSQDKFSWLGGHQELLTVDQALQSIFVGQLQSVPESFLAVLGGRLEVAASGGVLVSLSPDDDFVFVDGGISGTIILIQRYGELVGTGSQGSFLINTDNFTDASANFPFLGVSEGYRLKVTEGDARGSYLVKQLVGVTGLGVTPDFIDSGSFISWGIYEGLPTSLPDPSLIADVVYTEFNHLLSEPFQVKLLPLMGSIPPDATTQSASRLKAYVSDALASGRQIGWRVGLEGGPSWTGAMIALERTNLGLLANGTVFYPFPVGAVPTAVPRFLTGAFSIQIGATIYAHGGALTPVAVFSSPIPAGSIEYLASTGEFGFASDILADYAGQSVILADEFLSPTALASQSLEYAPSTGDVNFSTADMNTYSGQKVYFIEQLITEEQRDVSLSPMAGSFALNNPVREFTAVQVHYFQADLLGEKALDADGNTIEVTEYLPVYVRMEVCTRINEHHYSFNPTNRTVDQRIDPSIYVDVRLQNFGKVTAIMDYAANEIFFVEAVDPTHVVKINYAVFESFGGEISYNASTPPIYRPPFNLAANVSTVTLEGDRTADLAPGVMLRLADTPEYIKASVYTAASDSTSITIFPTPQVELGARSPGHDVVSLVTSRPVATSVDGVTVPEAPAGFWIAVTTGFEPIAKKSQTFKFLGDLHELAIAGHLLEIAGYPFIIDSSTVSDDGTYTNIKVTAQAPVNINSGAVKLSIRPVYPPGARDFILPDSFLSTEESELVLFGEVNDAGIELPGRTLIAGVEYTVNAESGLIHLTEDIQGPLQPGQTLYFSHTKVATLMPYVEKGQVIYPRVKADFHFVTTPSDQNGILGGTVKATYTYRNPDSFYTRVLPLQNYLPEVCKDVTAKGVTPVSGGALITSGGSPANYDVGGVGPNNRRRNLLDNDRAARVYLDLYNTTITSFEQILETISGAIVGDRDGRFRFFVGRNKDSTPPGYEDPITGELNPRNLWRDVFFAARTTNPIHVIESDDIVSPGTATLTNGVVRGIFLSADYMQILVDKQATLVNNDVDDRVLTSRQDLFVDWQFFPFYFIIRAKGNYHRMADRHILSRIFPELVRAFIRTLPGLAADLPSDQGDYAFLKLVINPDFDFLKGGIRLASTFGKTIGKFSNPVLGTIKNIVSTTLEDRRPRARIWGYSPTGYGSMAFEAAGRPAVIATPLLLKDFPINPTTGLPDDSQLVAQGGDLPDLSTGDVSLLLPPFLNYPGSTQVAFGEPTGALYSVGDANRPLSIFSAGRLAGVYVDRVLRGCIITFKDAAGTPIFNPNQIVKLDVTMVGGTPIDLHQGDTIYITPPGGLDTPPNDPPKQEDLERMADNMPSYRVGFDVGMRNKEGELVDLSAPSFHDPSFLGIKELLGQHTPAPGRYLEGEVQFTSDAISPIKIPALSGQDKNDDGEYTIPYLATTNTELDRFGEIPGQLAKIIETKSADATQYVYPDEILGDDGELYSFLSPGPVVPVPPATLITEEDLFPVAHGSTDEGIGDVQPYDLLLVEVDDAETVIRRGSQGILSVGSATWDATNSMSYVEPPRFVSPSHKNDRLRYIFNNIMTHVGGVGATGVTIQDTGVDTYISISSVGSIVFNDGTIGGTAGGFNNIVHNLYAPYPNGNTVSIAFINLAGVVFDFVTITGASVTSSSGAGVLTSVPTFTDVLLTLPGITGIIASAPPAGLPAGPFDFIVSINVAGLSPFPANTGSGTAFIDQDRLTFKEDIDMRSVQERGVTTAAGWPVQAELQVETISGSGADAITVNSAAEINGGLSFTFRSRNPAGTVGTFDPFPGTGEGSIKVMAWEGWGNIEITPIGGNQVVFSAIPSSTKDEVGVPTADGTICQGFGVCDGAAYAGGAYDNRVTEITTTGGATSKAQAGDILAITSASSVDIGTTKAGTYLVRHAVETNVVSKKYRALSILSPTGIGVGWLPFEWPRVENLNNIGTELQVSTLLSFDNPAIATSPSGHGFPGSGRVYIVLDYSKIASTDPNVYKEAVVSAAYTSITVGTKVFNGLSAYQDALGNALTPTEFASRVSEGQVVSGMTYLQPNFSNQGGLPSNNVVGYHDLTGGSEVVYGFRYLTLDNSDTGNNLIFDSQAGPNQIVAALPGAGQIEVNAATPVASTSFVPDVETPVYTNIPAYLNLITMTDAQWDALHTPAGLPGNPQVNCLLPGETFTTASGAAAGFYAQAGIFLEPSIPQSGFNLNDATAHVVDASHSLLPGAVGFRLSVNYGLLTSPERIYFEVRRIRRFHDVLEDVGANLQPLRFAYEIRRGTVLDYRNRLTDPATYGNQFAVMEATTPATQLGAFDNPDVNINAGDLFRLLDDDGRLIEEIKIQGVIDGTRLLLARPGITTIPPAQIALKPFEIYLKQAPVPHEQSNAELLDLITDEVVFTRTADYTAQTGGYVESMDLVDPLRDQYDKVVNKMKDDLITGVGSNTFPAQGIREDDILIVDPAGELAGPTGVPTIPEQGVRPFGDQSIDARGAPSYEAGRPSDLDDNRGFYRINVVNNDSLEVTGVSEFSGDFSNLPTDKVFPEGTPVSTYGYAVYPTTHDSQLNAAPFTSAHLDREGQMDLRPTSKAGDNGSPPNSFKDNFYSIRPFSYKIIRPSGLFSQEAIDLILLMRERLLSWMEEIEALISGKKAGSYFVFQRDEHAEDLGSPLIPDEGLGVLPNSLIEGVRGLESVTPFASSSDCLSILDRRFWILDYRLDSLVPPYTDFTNPVGGVVRPVLPDLISLVLDRRDKFRQLRYTWLNYRTHLVNGTLPAIDRLNKELPEKLDSPKSEKQKDEEDRLGKKQDQREKEKDLVLRKESLGDGCP